MYKCTANSGQQTAPQDCNIYQTKKLPESDIQCAVVERSNYLCNCPIDSKMCIIFLIAVDVLSTFWGVTGLASGSWAPCSRGICYTFAGWRVITRLIQIVGYFNVSSYHVCEREMMLMAMITIVDSVIWNILSYEMKRRWNEWMNEKNHQKKTLDPCKMESAR